MFKVKVDDEQFFFRNIHHDATVCFEPMFLENVESYEHVGFGSCEFIVAEPQRPKNEN